MVTIRMFKSKFNHIAFLVPSVVRAAESDTLKAFDRGPAEKWEGEGTLEIYIGPENSTGRILLMEPVADGAYRRAMKKRGPGLHHIAVDVLEIEAYISGLSGSGWLLHPRSLETLKASRTAYLARPGMPLLVEVQEQPQFSIAPNFIERIALPLSNDQAQIIKSLAAPELGASTDEALHLWTGGIVIHPDLIWQ